jgi:hypothetical protein
LAPGERRELDANRLAARFDAEVLAHEVLRCGADRRGEYGELIGVAGRAGRRFRNHVPSVECAWRIAVGSDLLS